MTRILVQRGSASSSSSRASHSPANQSPSSSEDEKQERETRQESVISNDSPPEQSTVGENNASKTDESPEEIKTDETGTEKGKSLEESPESVVASQEGKNVQDVEILGASSAQIVSTGYFPPPPPVPPPKPSNFGTGSRTFPLGSSFGRTVFSGRPQSWPHSSSWNSTSDLHPSSPRSYIDAEGYNSADEQKPCYGPSFNNVERELHFECDIRRSKGYEVKRMNPDGNCLFRAVADQVYGDPEAYDMVRQMCIDYMERERDHFSQFITEGFTSYCKRKRRDKAYGNNVEIQALCEMYNRPIHIYSYSTEPINIFHGGYGTDTPPIRLSYHRGNHYNSLIDPRVLSIGAGLGFNSLRGTNVDKDQVKAAIKAQQDQQIDNALLAEGRFYSDLELTEKEIERMVMEASRAEYMASNDDKLKMQMGFRESTPGAEPSSSAATTKAGIAGSDCVRTLMGMGFGYLQVMEACRIFGDDVDAILCFLLEADIHGGASQGKGKATE